MKNELLNELKELIEMKYGEIDDDGGCYINGRWFSPASIYTLMLSVDKEN